MGTRKNGKKATKKTPKRPVGRPKRVFTNGDHAMLLEMAAAGATITEMVRALKTGRDQVYKALAEDPKFKDAIQKAKATADDRVEHSLYERANGYEYTETTIEDGPKGRMTRLSRKHMAPDVAAAFIWLKNRRPDSWRDRREVAVSGVSLPEALDLCDET